MLNKLLLFTPGPVNVANNLRTAIVKEDICHREIEFDELLESIEKKLLKLFALEHPKNYRAVVITGSGTAANESMLSSVVGNKNILILSNGEFGDRLIEISKIHNKNTFCLQFPWGEKLNLKAIKKYLKENEIDIISMVHHETSSGMLNCLEDIGDLAKVNGSMFIVDCVSSAGAESIDMEKNNISFFSSSSSKAIGSYSGLSFVVGEKKAFENLKNIPSATTYLDLYKFYKYIKSSSQTPNTPAVHLFFALEQALTNILDEGISSRYDGISQKANRLRRGMEKLGLKFLIDKKDMCSVLTTVLVPQNVDVGVLRSELRKKSIVIYEGKGCFKGKVFQVGNIGELLFSDIQYFLKSLDKILASFKPIQINSFIPINEILPTVIPRPLSMPENLSENTNTLHPILTGNA